MPPAESTTDQGLANLIGRLSPRLGAQLDGLPEDGQ